MLGVFMALDFLLFFVFWETVLVPMYFIIAIWGGPRRGYAVDQVHDLYADRLGADAARHPDAVLPALQPVPDLLVRYRRPDAAAAALERAVVGLLGLLPRLRGEGADVAVPYLAARRARGGAHGRLGDPGQRPAEDGDVRIPALLAAAAAGGGQESDGRQRRWRCSRSSGSSTARWLR